MFSLAICLSGFTWQVIPSTVLAAGGGALTIEPRRPAVAPAPAEAEAETEEEEPTTTGVGDRGGGRLKGGAPAATADAAAAMLAGVGDMSDRSVELQTRPATAAPVVVDAQSIPPAGSDGGPRLRSSDEAVRQRETASRAVDPDSFSHLESW